MWPKALTQLLEFAPQIVNLLPLADRFFKEKASNDNAARQAIEDLQTEHRSALDTHRATVIDLSDRLHADIGALASQQATQAAQTAALQKQITDIDKHLTSTRADALAAKQATESLEGRLARIEAAQTRAQTLAFVAIALLAAILILIAALFLRAR